MTSVKEATSRVSSWGMVLHTNSIVRRPASTEEIRRALEDARALGLKVAFRGHGNSYGDASLNEGGMILDMTAMNRILEWDPSSSMITAEPGARLSDIWQHTVESGHWPPVVSGTMTTTLGGAAAMNIHGKNNYRLGTIGEHIEWFDLLLADGRELRCSRSENPDVFHAAIGGIGMLGAFTRLGLHLKKVNSGLVEVHALSARNFCEALDLLESHVDDSDYLVGWHDAFASGKSLGRGLLHRARHLAPGEDPQPERTLELRRQSLPSTFFGVIPKKWMWMGLWFFINDSGMRTLNAAKYYGGVMKSKGGVHLQSHAGYHFLLDYVPNYKFAFKPGGLIQYQVFVPSRQAARVFGRCIATSQAHGLHPYLLVTKRHRPDPFLMTHSVDGFSMAMDFRVTAKNRERLWRMLHGLDELVLDAGGRFYFAKDAVMRPAVLRRCYPAENLAAFAELKRKLDPQGIFESDMFRRVFKDA